MPGFIEINSHQLMLAADTVVLRADDYEAYLCANDLIERAHVRLQEAEQQAEGIYQAQREAGYQAGIEDARRQQAVLMHETMLESQRYYRQVAKRMSEVVLTAVRKVIADYDAEELTLLATREALAQVGKQEKVTLRVAPGEVESIRCRILSTRRDVMDVDHIEVVADPRITGSGCVLETDMGVVDATIELQLSALACALNQ